METLKGRETSIRRFPLVRQNSFPLDNLPNELTEELIIADGPFDVPNSALYLDILAVEFDSSGRVVGISMDS